MVWSDWGDVPKIERALQDGSERVTLVKDDIIWPNGLAVDYMTKRIYWLDAKLHTLNSIDYKGARRQVVLRSDQFIKHPFALDVFEDFVYWSDWELESVLKTNKFGGNNGSVDTVINGVYSVMDVRVVHPYVQPHAINRCQLAKCSHLCLPKGSTFRCACPSNKKLLTADNSTCVAASEPSSSTTPSSTTPRVTDPESRPAIVSSTSVPAADSENPHHHRDEGHHLHDDTVDYRNELREAADSKGSEEGGHAVVVIVAVLSTLSVFLAIITLVIYRNYQRQV